MPHSLCFNLFSTTPTGVQLSIPSLVIFIYSDSKEPQYCYSYCNNNFSKEKNFWALGTPRPKLGCHGLCGMLAGNPHLVGPKGESSGHIARGVDRVKVECRLNKITEAASR